MTEIMLNEIRYLCVYNTSTYIFIITSYTHLEENLGQILNNFNNSNKCASSVQHEKNRYTFIELLNH